MGKQQNLKWGVIVSYLWVAAHIGANFVFTPILIYFLGQGEYGLYQVVASFLAYVNVLETSLSTGVLRFYCEANVKEEQSRAENTLAACRIIYNRLIVFVLCLGAVLVAAFRVFYRSSFSASELREGSAMLALLILSLCVSMKNAVYLAGIRGNERFVFEKTIAVLNELLKPAVCLAVLFRFPYALAVVCVQVALNVLLSAVRYLYAKKELHIRVVLHKRDRRLERNILKFAGGILLADIADQIFWKTDQIILAKLYNTAAVAVYSIGSQIYINYMFAGIMMSGVFFPKLSLYYQEENGMEKISALFIKVGRLAFLLCLMILSGFVIFGREFLFLWAGEEYLPAYGIAFVVMVPFTVDIIQNLGLSILQVMNEYSFRAKMYFAAALLNIVSTVVLARHFAGFGAALSTGLTMFITSGIVMNVFYARVIHLDITSFWKNIASIFLRLLPVAAVCWVLNQVLGAEWALMGFALKLALYVVIYAAAAYFMVLNASEKEMVHKLVSSLLKKK